MGSYLWLWQRAQVTVSPRNPLVSASILSSRSLALASTKTTSSPVNHGPIPKKPERRHILARSFSGIRSAAICALTN